MQHIFAYSGLSWGGGYRLVELMLSYNRHVTLAIYYLLIAFGDP